MLITFWGVSHQNYVKFMFTRFELFLSDLGLRLLSRENTVPSWHLPTPTPPAAQGHCQSLERVGALRRKQGVPLMWSVWMGEQREVGTLTGEVFVDRECAIISAPMTWSFSSFHCLASLHKGNGESWLCCKSKCIYVTQGQKDIILAICIKHHSLKPYQF